MRSLKLNENSELSHLVIHHLKKGWSPEQICGRLKRDNKGVSLISHETIYRWIYSDFGKRNRYYSYLRKKRFLRSPRGTRKSRITIPERVSIAERPNIIGLRQEFGHWEGDLMMFSRGTTSNLITLRERMSRYIVAIINPSRHAEETSRRILEYFSGDKMKSILSLTLDNGPEFYAHLALVKELGIKTFFCDPYKSWQKGTVENGNGTLRIELPRSTPLNEMTQKEINDLVKTINRRPMKCLGYKTPEEVFNENLRKL
ncbi:MAG: IS30 family transposase [Bacteroidetes bacterium]|nr:IS30 family transposase [Bacteroidota bacterium]